jgi:crossover junction endodeoxyribonuclease RuvC
VTHYIGIDPGLTGAVAIVDRRGDLVDVYDMPVVDRQVNAVDLALSFDTFPADEQIVAIERVASRPGQGVASVFRFGVSYGIVVGVVGALGHRTLHPTPSKWKADMGLSADKERSRKAAIDRWPRSAAWFARKKDDGRAEAALLALWCWENAGGLDVAS